MREGIALVVSAPSGAGKSTLCKMLAREFPQLRYSISCTTRPMRKGEKDGVDYLFLSREEFEQRIDAGGFAEWAEVHGNLYGTPLAPVREILASGKDLLFDVDVKGASQIRLTVPKASFVFILPPRMRELEKRLHARNLDDETSIQIRLDRARDEIREALWYDALIINDDLQTAYEQFRAFYLAAALAPARHLAFLNELLEEQWRNS